MKLWKKILLSVVAVIVLIVVYYLIPVTYSGKIIDVDTGEPLEGAVVVAEWSEETATVTGGASQVKDVRETLTDKNGEWKIRGPRGKDEDNLVILFTFVTGVSITSKPSFIIFKPGYCSIPGGRHLSACRRKKVIRESGSYGRGATIGLPKLENREDRKRNQMISLIYDGNEIIKKQREFIRLLNIERRELGLEERRVLKEIEGEQ